MRSILFAVIGLAASTVYANKCAADCAMKFGMCMLGGDAGKCAKESAACAAKCFLPWSHHHDSHKKVKSVTPQVKNEKAKCALNCGVEFTKCLMTTFDPVSCGQKSATCALGCAMGEKAHFKHEAPVKVQGKSEFAACQKDCGIEFGKCLVTTFDFKTCAQQEGACAIGCLGKLDVYKKHHTEISVKGFNKGSCQSKCANSFTQCLFEDWNLDACIGEQAQCVISCVAPSDALAVKSGRHHHETPMVKSFKCSMCKVAMNTIEEVLPKLGCSAAGPIIDKVCSRLGCASLVKEKCPSFISMIQQKFFSADKACSMIRMC